MSDKIDFKTEKKFRERKGQLHNDKSFSHQEDRVILNIMHLMKSPENI